MRLPSSHSIALVLEALVALAAARAAVRAVPLARLLQAGRVGLQWIGRRSRGNDLCAADVSLAIERARLALPGTTPCLAKALAAKAMLGRRGMDAQLRIGVRKTESDVVQAHAWVEHHGTVVIGGDVALFTPFPRPL